MHSSQLSDILRAFGRSVPLQCVNPDTCDQDTQAKSKCRAEKEKLN
jgi:hypothetical protein